MELNFAKVGLSETEKHVIRSVAILYSGMFASNKLLAKAIDGLPASSLTDEEKREIATSTQGWLDSAFPGYGIVIIEF